MKKDIANCMNLDFKCINKVLIIIIFHVNINIHEGIYITDSN